MEVGGSFPVFLEAVLQTGAENEDYAPPQRYDSANKRKLLLGPIAWSLCLSRAGSATKPRFQVWYSTAVL